MALGWLIAQVERQGVKLTVRDGKLLASPPGLLTPDQRRLLAEHRADLIAELSAADDVADAIAERAWIDPPDFPEPTVDTVPFVLRESVIIRCPGLPTIAVSPQLAATLDGLAAWNRSARERAAKKQQTKHSQRPTVGLAMPGPDQHQEGF